MKEARGLTEGKELVEPRKERGRGEPGIEPNENQKKSVLRRQMKSVRKLIHKH